MNSPVIWILIPLIVAGLLYLFRRYRRVIAAAGILFALLLAWLAWQVPIGQSFNLGAFPLPSLKGQVEGPWEARVLFRQSAGLRIDESLAVLGREFVLPDQGRPILIFIYLGIALWFGGALAANSDRLFIPLGLVIASLLTAALAVRPFLYAALLIEVTVLVSIPILSPPGKPVGQGVLRFLTFQTLGMPLILLSAWLLTSSDAPIPETQIARAAIFAGLGLTFLASVFPFHTWIPMVAEESHPYAAGFIFFILPTLVSLFSLAFLRAYVLEIAPPFIWTAIRFMGLVMIVIGGLWCAFQVHLGRMMGFAAVVEIGLFLLAFGLGPGKSEIPGETALSISLAQILPRGIAMAIWALSLAIIQRKRKGLNFKQVQGVIRETPIASFSIILALFSLAGLPLLAGFPIRMALWSALAEQSLSSALFALGGSAAMLLGGVRALSVLVSGQERSGWKISENRFQILLLLLGWMMLFLIGLMPQLILGPLGNMVNIFSP